MHIHRAHIHVGLQPHPQHKYHQQPTMTTCSYIEEKTHYNSKNRTSGLNYAKRNTKLFYKKGCVCRNGRKGEKLLVCKKEVVEMAEKI